MKDIIFRPKYTFRYNWYVIVLSLLLIFMAIFYFSKVGIDLQGIFLLVLLGYFLAFFSRDYIRRIVFTSSSFSVEKYVWVSKKIEYSDIVDVGISMIKTRRGNIVLAGMSNVAELLYLIKELIEQKKINEKQIENKVVVEESILSKSYLPSIVISALLWVSLMYFWPVYRSRFGGIGATLSFTLIFASVLLIMQWIIRRSLKK
jgi:hypothetical protein